jgi:hypothetical protein
MNRADLAWFKPESEQIARRAFEILDVLHRSEEGAVLLPDYAGEDVEVDAAVKLNRDAAELLVRTKFAEWSEPAHAGRRLLLRGVLEKDL